MWTAVVFSGAAALFLAMAIAALVHQRWLQRLPASAALPARGEGATSGTEVRCSVIVPARDEGDRLEGTVRRLLAQAGVSIDVIVVDDRSADQTGEILRRLTAADARVHAIRIESLPAGWLGKCHACHVGASAATGDWILFIDADCWMAPDVIARALDVARRDGVDHITLTPSTAAQSAGARAWHLALLTRLASRVAGVNRDRAGAHFGMGAFNLIRASAYRDSGGYEALRLTIVDDVKLGLLLRRAGKRTRAFLGGTDVECLWGTTVRGMTAVMEKNYFAAADFRVAPVAAMAVFGAVLYGAAIIGPWTGTAAGLAAGLAPWSLVVPAAILGRRLGWSFGYAAITPLLYPLIVYAVINSAVVTLRHGGVQWRDTFYPLDMLREGTVR
jgi:hypothetical protein